MTHHSRNWIIDHLQHDTTCRLLEWMNDYNCWWQLWLSMVERKLTTSCNDSFRFCTSVSNSLLSSKPILSSGEMSIKTKQRIVFQTLRFLRNLGFIAFSSSNRWFLNILCCLGNGHILQRTEVDWAMMIYPWWCFYHTYSTSNREKTGASTIHYTCAEWMLWLPVN